MRSSEGQLPILTIPMANPEDCCTKKSQSHKNKISLFRKLLRNPFSTRSTLEIRMHAPHMLYDPMGL